MAGQGENDALAGFFIRHGAILQQQPAGGHGMQGSSPIAQGFLPHLGQLIEGSQHSHRIDALAVGRRQRGVGLARQPGARQAPEPLHKLRSKLLWNGFGIADEPIDRVQSRGGVVADVMALNRGAAFRQQLDRGIGGEAGGFHQDVELAAADQIAGTADLHAVEQPMVIGEPGKIRSGGLEASRSSEQFHRKALSIVVFKEREQKRSHNMIADLRREKTDPQPLIASHLRQPRGWPPPLAKRHRRSEGRLGREGSGRRRGLNQHIGPATHQSPESLAELQGQGGQLLGADRAAEQLNPKGMAALGVILQQAVDLGHRSIKETLTA